jgi:hypothetical protein
MTSCSRAPADLLRVVRKGRAVKDTVDIAIDRSGEVENLRDSIEDARVKAEEAPGEAARREYTNMGLSNLRRYFQLILFQAYLQSIEPDTAQTLESFETFVQSRPGAHLASIFRTPMLKGLCSDQDVREGADDRQPERTPATRARQRGRRGRGGRGPDCGCEPCRHHPLRIDNPQERLLLEPAEDEPA